MSDGITLCGCDPVFVDHYTHGALRGGMKETGERATLLLP